MTIKTRQETREALGALLAAEFVGTGKLCQATYDYLKSTFDGQSPVLTVGSEGLAAGAFTLQGLRPDYYYSVNSFVARDSGEETAEDLLDQIAQEFYTTVEEKRKYEGYWQYIEIVDRTQIVPVMVGGDPYWLETFIVKVTVF